jgi:hypothetical protein
VGGQDRRRRQAPASRQHSFEVIVQGDDRRAVVEGVEPVRSTIEQQHGNIRQRAWAEAAALVEMDNVPQLAPLPLLVVQVGRHR